jgi:hypothetical protein
LNAAWRATQGRFAPSPQAFRLTSAPGRAAGGPRPPSLPQAQAALQRFKHALVVASPPRSSGQQIKLSEGTSPRAIPCRCTDKVGNVCSIPLYICRVVLLLLRQRRGATGLGEL